jgi:hypothetical protein
MIEINQTRAIDEVIARVRSAPTGLKLSQRLQADEVMSCLGDLCSLLRCHYLDLPVQLVDLALRDGGTSREELVDELIQMRVHPMVAA